MATRDCLALARLAMVWVLLVAIGHASVRAMGYHPRDASNTPDQADQVFYDYPRPLVEQITVDALPDDQHGYGRTAMDILNRYRDSLERRLVEQTGAPDY